MEVRQEHIDFWRRRQAKQKLYNQRLMQLARADLPQIIQMLIKEFGATKVILFGSLAKGRFRAESDIDIAVEGIPRGKLFPAQAAANRLTRLGVDLKPLEDLEPHFKNRLLATGEVLYARDLQ
jgi:predicted nucleotidyltransferase